MGNSTPDTSALDAASQAQLTEQQRQEDEERKKAEQERIAAMRSQFGSSGDVSGGASNKSSLLGG